MQYIFKFHHNLRINPIHMYLYACVCIQIYNVHFYTLFLKLKARLVAGGHMQDKTLFNQDQTSSPTALTSSIFSIISTGISESMLFMS